MSALDIPGFSALQCVISSLRDTAHFTDEEGDLTDKLRDLRDWVSIRAAVQAAQPEAVGEPWGVDANKLLSNAMKPSEIAGPADVQRRRVSELLSWFARLADGQANPKWTTEHAFELAYYIASAPTPEPMSAPTEAKPAQQDAVDASIPLDKEELAQLIAEHLGGTYHCNRVWEAWNVGTMSQDDFEPVDESETPTKIAEAIIDAIRAAISAKKVQP